MASFNSDLKNLFFNWKNQQTYNKKAFDANKDGKIDGNDKTYLANQEKELLSKANLFDVNGDGIFNQTDVDMFVKGDVDGNKKITKEELNFIAKYKTNLTNTYKTKKLNYTVDGKKYVKGQLANGVYDNKYYQKGVLATGTANGKYYVKGNLANGTYNKIIYKNGVKYTGMQGKKYYKDGKVGTGVYQNKYYKNGSPATGTVGGKYYVKGNLANGTYNKIIYKNGVKFTGLQSGKFYKDGKIGTGVYQNKYYQNGSPATGTVGGKYYVNGNPANGTYNNLVYKNGVKYTGDSGNNTYKNGVFQYSVVKNSQDTYPKRSADTIQFSDGMNVTSVKLNVGDKAIICNDNTLKITDKNGTEKYYSNKGILLKALSNNGDKLTKYNEDGTIRYSITEAEAKKYLKDYTNSWLNKINATALTERLFEDVYIVKTAEEKALKMGKKGSVAYNNAFFNAVKSQMIKTVSNMKNEIGEIVEKYDGLYVNTGNQLTKLNISAETYLYLFPPIERYDVNQGNIGDCYFISGCLIDMMKNPKAFSQLVQMFSENANGDISITFKGNLKNYSPVTFQNGDLKVVDGKVNGKNVTKYTIADGSTGLQMLEQAYAISTFSFESGKTVSQIDIDEAIPYIEYGWQDYAYEDVLDCDTYYTTASQSSNYAISTSVIQNNKTAINKVEKSLLQYLESVKAYKTSENELTKKYYVNDDVLIDLQLVSLFYKLAYNKDVFAQCTTNGSPNAQAFRNILNDEYVSTLLGSYKSYLTNLSNDQLNSIISSAKSSNFTGTYYNYYLKDESYYKAVKNSKMSNSVYEFIETSFVDSASIATMISKIKANGLYNTCITQATENNKKGLNYITSVFDKYADNLNKGNILFSIAFRKDISSYNIVSNHAYSVEKIDTDKKVVYVTNPWYGGVSIAVPYSVVAQAINNAFMDISVGYMKN